MTDAQLFKEISSLPETLKQQVADFIAFLKKKREPSHKKERQLGLAKGKIIIKDSFDDPIADFDAYQ
ncbi:MAG: DUF2281 domain-containing protein [Flavipsychrobacter sp.]|nr:DUF2281 domain-containing protein [Flavipsychrobacter sp.]